MPSVTEEQSRRVVSIVGPTATVTHAGRHNLIADPDPKAGQTYAVRH